MYLAPLLSLLIIALSENDSHAQPYPPPTLAQVTEIRNAMKTVLTGRRIARAVRLAFHDCVGGCDGCLNRDHPDNIGEWLETVDAIDFQYDTFFSTYMSRADFYILSSIIAIENGIDNVNAETPNTAHPAEIPFLYGRVDCPTSPTTNVNNTFPDGHIAQEVFDFMMDEFDIDKVSLVALMGAHTLGGATGSSGFQGFWKEDEAAGFLFDSGYYQNLMDPGLTWTQIDKSNVTGFPTSRFQWEGRDGNGDLQSFMLNVDVAMRFTLDFTDPNNPLLPKTGQSFCDFTTCPIDHVVQDEVIEYLDINEWIEAFVDPFVLMTSNGGVNLQEFAFEFMDGVRSTRPPPTVAQVAEIRNHMEQVITGRKIARVVRLAFHDCVGGCDGCLNHNHPDNVGEWLETVNELNDIYDNNYSSYMSRADFYILCSIVAVENGIKNVNVDAVGQTVIAPPADIPFVAGRVDCDTSPFTNKNNSFPDGHIAQEVFDFMRAEFGLDKRELVALMGAHTLGGATGKNASGFLGFWKEDEEAGFRFDSGYYRNLMDPDLTWTQLDKSDVTEFPVPRWQWEGRDSNGNLRSFMLNVDVAMRFALDFGDPNTGQSFCGFENRLQENRPFPRCPIDDRAQSEVIEYLDIEEWIEAFVDPFFIMTINKGVDLVQPVYKSSNNRALTIRQVTMIKRAMKKVLTGRKIARAVRLSFHDCVGGCDGCLNRNHPDNVGEWLETVDEIDYHYDTYYYNYMSRADFYILCAIAAIENGVDNVNKDDPESAPFPHYDFLYGRVDCPTSPITDTNHTFPDGHIGQEVFDFMFDEFGIPKEDLVALMGAHTLGGATGQNASGFLGFWKEDEEAGFKFDSGYYQNLLSPDLTFTQIDKSSVTNFPSPRFQWEGFNANNELRSFMLNVDVAMRFKLDFTDPNNPLLPKTGQSFCDFDTCVVDDEVQDEAIEYLDIDEWIAAFADPFDLMISNGAAALYEPVE